MFSLYSVTGNKKQKKRDQITAIKFDKYQDKFRVGPSVRWKARIHDKVVPLWLLNLLILMKNARVSHLYLSGELCLQLPEEEMMCFSFCILDLCGNMEVISN